MMIVSWCVGGSVRVVGEDLHEEDSTVVCRSLRS